jgi:hypothetical protein
MSSTRNKYYIKKITNIQCKNDISSRSDEFKNIQAPIIFDINTKVEKTIDRDEYIKSLIDDIDKAKNIYYANIPAPDDDEITRMVIGKGGCYFYLTTINNYMLFIWHNRDTRQFEFWGTYAINVKKSIGAIYERINRSLKNKLKSIKEQYEKLNVDENSIIHENIKYNKIKIDTNHYFVKETKDKNPPVYTIVGENLLGKCIGNYVEYDSFTKGPTIRLSYDSIFSNCDDEKKE